MSYNCFPFFLQPQHIHQRLQSVQAEHIKFKCPFSICLSSNNLFSFQHFSIIFTFNLTQNLNTRLLSNLFFFNLITAIFSLLWKKLILRLFFELKIIIYRTQLPISTKCFVNHLCLKKRVFFNLTKVKCRSLDAAITHVRFDSQLNLVQIVFFFGLYLHLN